METRHHVALAPHPCDDCPVSCRRAPCKTAAARSAARRRRSPSRALPPWPASASQSPMPSAVQARKCSFAFLQCNPFQILIQSHRWFVSASSAHYFGNGQPHHRTLVHARPAAGTCAITAPGLTGSLGGALPLPTGATGTLDITGCRRLDADFGQCAPARSPRAIQ